MSWTNTLAVPGVVYSLKVAAFTNGGRGPFSDHVHVNIPKAGMGAGTVMHDTQTEFFSITTTYICIIIS